MTRVEGGCRSSKGTLESLVSLGFPEKVKPSMGTMPQKQTSHSVFAGHRFSGWLKGKPPGTPPIVLVTT